MAVEIIRGINCKIDETVKIIGDGKLILGNRAQIRAFSVIELDGTLTIGEQSVLGYHGFIQCSGEVIIGKGTLIGPSCVLLGSSHQITTVPLVQEAMLRSKLILGDNIWIGALCTINHGISLGDNCIIGANSFVNRSVEANAIVGGVPAKHIRYR
jgi:acetyltransferase-like isoleucine patch superfamily enzyme